MSSERWHGTLSGYGYHKCRCDECKAASKAYQSSPELVAKRKAWKIANAQKDIQHKANWASRNKEAEKVRKAQWQKDNPQINAEHSRKRRARVNAATIVPFTLHQLELKSSMFKGCWICDGPKESWDHVKPLAKGGAHCLSNLRPACLSCNSGKKDNWPFTKTLDEVS